MENHGHIESIMPIIPWNNPMENRGYKFIELNAHNPMETPWL